MISLGPSSGPGSVPGPGHGPHNDPGQAVTIPSLKFIIFSLEP